jgi:small conductance mechanosensitive channel
MRPQKLLQSVSILAVAFIFMLSAPLIAAEKANTVPKPKPVTTENPEIANDELDLLLGPLTKKELLIEADGWLKLVKSKAQETAKAQIVVKRENQKLKEAAKEQGDSAVVDNEQGEKSVNEKTVDLMEGVTKLREERTLLLDSMLSVVDEIQVKTDPDDSATMAALKDYRLYMKNVSGITVYVSDATSAWLSIKGWMMSDEGGKRWVANIAKFITILILTWILARITDRVMRKITHRTEWSELLENFLVKAVQWVVWIAGIIWALTLLEVSMTPLLTMIGAAGFIVAFATQDSLSNIANGVMILIFRPFDIGDVVEAGGAIGKVESTSLVSTAIRTSDNELMVVPNKIIWGDVIKNKSARGDDPL